MNSKIAAATIVPGFAATDAGAASATARDHTAPFVTAAVPPSGSATLNMQRARSKAWLGIAEEAPHGVNDFGRAR